MFNATAGPAKAAKLCSGVGTKFTLGVQKGVWSIVFMTLVSSLY